MSRPIEATADHKRREDRQRRLVRERDTGCQLERRLFSGRWVVCGKKSAQDTVHAVRRNQCGDVWDHPDVALLGCRACHKNLDGDTLPGDAIYEVRVPYAFQLRAYQLARENTKSEPYAVYDPNRNSVYKDVWEKVS